MRLLLLLLCRAQVWPLINIINFKFIPPKLQVLFGNLASIFWMTYVPWMGRMRAGAGGSCAVRFRVCETLQPEGRS